MPWKYYGIRGCPVCNQRLRENFGCMMGCNLKMVVIAKNLCKARKHYEKVPLPFYRCEEET